MWHLNSWTKFYSEQLPKYNNTSKLKFIEHILKQLSPLVSSKEIDLLKKELSLVSQRKAFIIQLGECAERFIDCFNEENNLKFYKFFTKISQTVENKLQVPVINIGRIAGQFAKPRSNLLEKNNINAFRGEIINSYELNEVTRIPNPTRMLLAYFASKESIRLLNKARLNILLNFRNLDKTVNFSKLYISHEALLLNYEASLTKKLNNVYYNLGAHMLWLGIRTSHYPSPHIEYLRGISNPIGIKVHKNMLPLDLVKLIKLFNPPNELGKIILIVRFSNQDINNFLPIYIKTILKENLNVVFICDPMHGNTQKVKNYKVRKFCDLVYNIKQFITICNQHSVFPGGIHLEATYLNVTECLGGGLVGITESDLHKNYKTTCDPRLNYSQTMELISNMLKFGLN